jgi:hypothetical protein
MTAVAAPLLMAFRTGQSFGAQHGQPLLQPLAVHIFEADQFERRRVNPSRKGCLFAPALRSSKCRARADRFVLSGPWRGRLSGPARPAPARQALRGSVVMELQRSHGTKAKLILEIEAQASTASMTPPELRFVSRSPTPARLPLSVYPGRRLKRPSRRRLIGVRGDVAGQVLVNGLNDRRRRILAEATEARASIAIEKARAACRLRELTGGEE